MKHVFIYPLNQFVYSYSKADLDTDCPSQEWIAFQQKIPPTGPVRERVASINSLVPRNP